MNKNKPNQEPYKTRELLIHKQKTNPIWNKILHDYNTEVMMEGFYAVIQAHCRQIRAIYYRLW